MASHQLDAVRHSLFFSFCHADKCHKALCAVTSNRNDILPSPALLQQGYQSRRSSEWQSPHTASLPACPGSLSCRGSKQRSWSSANESALQYMIMAAVHRHSSCSSSPEMSSLTSVLGVHSQRSPICQHASQKWVGCGKERPH